MTLRITRGVGFQLKFANGWTVSVQFGEFHYCNNNSRGKRIVDPYECKNAEVGLIPPGDREIKVKGWIEADEVARIITQVQSDPETIYAEFH